MIPGCVSLVALLLCVLVVVMVMVTSLVLVVVVIGVGGDNDAVRVRQDTAPLPPTSSVTVSRETAVHQIDFITNSDDKVQLSAVGDKVVKIFDLVGDSGDVLIEMQSVSLGEEEGLCHAQLADGRLAVGTAQNKVLIVDVVTSSVVNEMVVYQEDAAASRVECIASLTDGFVCGGHAGVLHRFTLTKGGSTHKNAASDKTPDIDDDDTGEAAYLHGAMHPGILACFRERACSRRSSAKGRRHDCPEWVCARFALLRWRTLGHDVFEQHPHYM